MIPILMNKHDCIAKTPIILHVHLGEVFIVERFWVRFDDFITATLLM